MIKELFYMVICFFCGSLPFSYWIGLVLAKTDIRTLKDGNPGASNVFRTGHKGLGIFAMVMDFAKGFIPLFILKGYFNPDSAAFVALFVAPVLGHAFSPFLKFRGGKAVAVTFGIWAALTLWIVPAVLGSVYIIVSLCIVISEDGWKVMLGFAAVAIFLAIAQAPLTYWVILILNAIIVGYMHRKDLAKPLHISLNSSSQVK